MFAVCQAPAYPLLLREAPGLDRSPLFGSSFVGGWVAVQWIIRQTASTPENMTSENHVHHIFPHIPVLSKPERLLILKFWLPYRGPIEALLITNRDCIGVGKFRNMSLPCPSPIGIGIGGVLFELSLGPL